MPGNTSLKRNLSSSQLLHSAGQYSTSEVADLVGLKATQVRHYVRRDLLTPLRGRRGEFRFSFQDVVMLRSAKELLDADVPVRRANRVLLGLKARNAAASRPLSSLRVQAEGTRVVVQEGNNAWDAESGQGTLPFLSATPDSSAEGPTTGSLATLSLFGAESETARHAPEAEILVTDQSEASVSPSVGDDAHGRKNSEGAPESGNQVGGLDEVQLPEMSKLSSDDWYNLALDLEEADPEKAPAAYRQALALNPKNTDAEVNLGRLCQLRGDLKQARRHYKIALAGAPEHQLANYNMGTIYDELDEFDTAVRFYSLAKNIPDAHYNLARLFELRGNELAALRHMREYRRLLDVDP